MHQRLDPLTALARRLRRYHPPSLRHLTDLLEGVEDYKAFLDLVREYLPEQEAEIDRASTSGGKMAIFCRNFSDRYFPLEGNFADEAWGDEIGYEKLVGYIPIQPMGWDDDWHDVDNIRDGDALIGALFVSDNAFTDTGIRTVWLEHCAGVVDQKQLQRMPEEGWSNLELRRLLNGTKFEGAAHLGDWMNHDTDTIFLDVTYEMNFLDPWEPRVVNALCGYHQQAEVKLGQIMEMADWLEAEPTSRFRELLDFIFEREALLGASRGTPMNQTLLEVFAEEDGYDLAP